MRYAFSCKPFPENASQAEIIAHKHDDSDVYDWLFRREIFDALPDRLAIPIAHQYNRIYEAEGRQAANLSMHDVRDNLNLQSLKLSASDDEVVIFAKWLASELAYYRSMYPVPEKALKAINAYIKKYHHIDLKKQSSLFKNLHIVTDTEMNASKIIEASPVSDTVTVTDSATNVTKKTNRNVHNKRNVTLGLLNRLCDDLFWRRMLRNVTLRNVEEYSIKLGLVHQGAGTYISDESFERRQQQKRRNKRALESTILVNELGDEMSLLELAMSSLANRKNRRNELMTRIRGFDDTSVKHNHQAMVYTITCPSKMHAWRSKSNTPNPKYNGFTPSQSQQYIVKIWSQIRSKLQRLGIEIYGFRVAEPHHDGTPHWHLLLFVDPNRADQLTEVIREYAMREDGDEDGAAERRLDVIKIDPKKGSATGYIAKYISKSIDGFGLDQDLYGNEASSAAERVVAWASLWGIRQFQQIGGPPVTVYRELRRIEGKGLTGIIKTAHEAADDGNWAAFVEAMGGPFAKRKERPIQVSRTWSDELNRYQEPKGYRITGLEAGNVTVLTRLHTWTLKTDNKPNSESLNQWKPIPINKIEDSPDYDQGIFEKIRGLGS